MKKDTMKIMLHDGDIVTRKELFARNERFHKQQARLPFRKKMEILVRLQRIVHALKPGAPKSWY
jgi:hypothetical protein